MKDRYDIVIAGAGPAGSATAIRLALAGRKVAIVEKAVFPRPKLCGEFISPECLQHFDTLGVMPAITLSAPVDIDRTVFYTRSGRRLTVESDWFGMSKPAIGLSRASLDDLLLNRAAEAGVDVIEGVTVKDILRGDDRTVTGIQLKEAGHRVHAGLTIDATGRTRALVRRVSKHDKLQRPPQVAFKAHFENTSLENGACEIYSYRGGYGGCGPVEDGRFNLCFIVDARETRERGSDGDRMLKEVVFSNRRARSVLEKAVRVTDWIAVPVDRYGRQDPVPAPGLIAVGDAASFIDPFTGSGILLALQSARVAAAAIIAHADERSVSAAYGAAYSRFFDGRLRIASLIRHVAFVPAIADATIAGLSLSRRVAKGLAWATRSGRRDNHIDSLSASD